MTRFRAIVDLVGTRTKDACQPLISPSIIAFVSGGQPLRHWTADLGISWDDGQRRVRVREMGDVRAELTILCGFILSTDFLLI